MRYIVVFIFIFNLSLLGQTGTRLNISDTSIKKHYFDLDGYNSDGLIKFILAGWDYSGGGIYEISDYNSDNHFRVLYLNKDINLFTVKILTKNYRDYSHKLILAGGNYSKCLCGMLLRKYEDSTAWEEVAFDDTNIPFVNSIFCIATNSSSYYKPNEYSRVLLGCSNGSIYYSDDDGKKFAKSSIIADNENIKRIIFYNDSIGLALAGLNYYACNKIYKTTNGGTIWFLAHDFTNNNLNINDIILRNDENNHTNTAYILGSSDGKGIILKSTDFGKNFNDIRIDSTGSLNVRGIVSGYFMRTNKPECAVIDENGVLGVLNYLGEFQYPYLIESELLPLGKFIKFNNYDNTSIACGYNGIVYQYGTPLSDIDEIRKFELSGYHFDVQSRTLHFTKKETVTDFSNLKIFNFSGNCIFEISKSDSKTSDICLGHLPTGIYFFILNGKISSFSGKFLIY